MLMPLYIKKRDGRVDDFNLEKIKKAINNAVSETKLDNQNEIIEKIYSRIKLKIGERFNGNVPHFSEIKQIVIDSLIETGYSEVSSAFKNYTKIENGRLKIEKYFTKDENYIPVQWEKSDIQITDEMGKPLFIQKNVEFPAYFSNLSRKIIASRYFYGDIKKMERENSFKQIVNRVSQTFAKWSLKQRYLDEKEAEIFKDELSYLTLTQRMAFNSPVWFNVGTDIYESTRSFEKKDGFILRNDEPIEIPIGESHLYPQTSACFIQDVQDNMEDIMDLAKREAMLFKHGSGTGTDLSTLRSSREKLSGGGKPSGPLQYLVFYDKVAGIVKSGGKTRRAAKMNSLKMTHPDIKEFIESKVKEQKKIELLMDNGIDGREAIETVSFQNVNISVRANDEFMRAVEKDLEWQTIPVHNKDMINEMPRYKARELFRSIAEGTYNCGDPGIQFDDTMNKWHTCSNSGRINSSNPCSEYNFVDNSSCNLASLNLRAFVNMDGSFNIKDFENAIRFTAIAQDLEIDNSSFPTKKIAENSHKFRPLGMGYANLGSLIMSLGLAYDSDEARAIAEVITALMTAKVYETSTEMAEKLGSFEEFEKNRVPMLRVIKMHIKALENIDKDKIPKEYKEVYDAAKRIWNNVLIRGERYGFRNAQATVLAPTGCLISNSLISTNNGLIRLGNIGNKKGNQWQDVSLKVMTDEGPKDATKFYINGEAETKRIRTSCGYEIQGTEKHKIKILDSETGELKWKKFSELEPEDIIPLAMNTIFGDEKEVLLPPKPELYWNNDFEMKVPEKMNEDLAEIIGYFMGDGSLHSKGLRFCVDNKDDDVIENLKIMMKNLFNLDIFVSQKKGYKEVAVNSVPLVMWWVACGFSKLKPSEEHKGKGYSPYIPDAILHTNNRKIYSKFLKGLYEADGTVNNGVPSISTVNKEFSEEIKTLLLSLGYATITKIDKTGWSNSDLYVLRLKNCSYNKRFLDNIGFIGKRKENAILISQGFQSGKNDHIYLNYETADEIVPVGISYRDIVLMSLRRNKAISREMAMKIYQDTNHPQLLWLMQFFYDKITDISDGGIQSTYDLSVPENVSYVANGFISHNTIGFLMDCDTKGIEPEIGLVQTKLLAEGGVLKIVNGTVKFALKKLGYNEEQIKRILEYIEKNETIEESEIKDEHLAIFDCSNKPAHGKRTINTLGHIKMMAAVQPFLSGAISKTVNMPNEATIEDIENIYIEAWKLGLKAVAIYRDGSKRLQPLSFTKNKEETLRTPIRRKLPITRNSVTHKFNIAGHEGYLTAGLYEDGNLGELFITMSEEGSTVGGLMGSLANMTSMALQYGVPLKTITSKFKNQRFEPLGIVLEGRKDIKTSSSIVDYIGNFLEKQFLIEKENKLINRVNEEIPKEVSIKNKIKEEKLEKKTELENTNSNPESIVEDDSKFKTSFEELGKFCPSCGSRMVRKGHCAEYCKCGYVELAGCGG